MNITDEMLSAAAPEAAERWLSSLPEQQNCGHDFSLTFQASMAPLLGRRRRRWRTLGLLAAVLTALGVLLALGVSAERPNEYGVYAAQGEGYASYLIRPKNSGFDQAIHPLTPEWIPEDFVQTGMSVQEDCAFVAYGHRVQSQRFALNQWHGKENSATLLGNYDLETVQIGGNEAILLSAQEDGTGYLLWTQGADAFLLSAVGMEREEILRIAEHIKW